MFATQTGIRSAACMRLICVHSLCDVRECALVIRANECVVCLQFIEYIKRPFRSVLFFSHQLAAASAAAAAGHRTHQRQSHHKLLAKLKNSLAPPSIPLSLCIWAREVTTRACHHTHILSLYKMKYWPDAMIMMAFTMGPITRVLWLYFKCAWAAKGFSLI
jgi:hypothetical protein